MSLDHIKNAFYVNIVTIQQGYYNDNGHIKKRPLVCLKIGFVDGESSNTNRNMSIRCKEHKKKYGGISIPLLICELYHPRILETYIKTKLVNNLKIMYVSGPKVSKSTEFYPITSTIMKEIIKETIIKAKEFDTNAKIRKNNEYVKKINKCIMEDDYDGLFELIYDYIGYEDDELTIINSYNDSLNNSQQQKLEQNSVLNTY